MAIGKKRVAVLLIIVLVVLGAELAIQHFSNFEFLRSYIESELAARLQAEVAIDRVALDILPRPELEMRDVRLVFADGSQLRVPVVGLYPSLKGLLAARPEIVTIRLERPDARIVLQAQESESATSARKARLKEYGAYIESLLQAIPSGIKIHDGSVRIKSPGGSGLTLEDVEAKAEATLQGVRVSAGCSSALWKRLGVTLDYTNPEAVVELDARAIDIVQSRTALSVFTNEALPAADVLQSLSGTLSSVALTISIPRIAEPAENIAVSGRGSFKDIDVTVPDMNLAVKGLAGGFELDNDGIAFDDVSARYENSSIQNAGLYLERNREFAPSRITADVLFDFVDVPGLLHLIPDQDVRDEIALIREPTGTVRATVEIRAEEDGYSAQVALDKLRLRSSYRAFPQNLELSRGTCTYRDDVLSFEGFSGKLGSSNLPDFSLSLGLGDSEEFSAAAQGATIVLDDLRMALSSFDGSRELIEKFSTSPGGRVKVETLALAGPMTNPEKWTVTVDALLADISVSAAGFDGPLAITSGTLSMDKHVCSLSSAAVHYLDADLVGSLTLHNYYEGIRSAEAEFKGSLGEKSLASINDWCELPPMLALRAPVELKKSKITWNRAGAATVDGDFVLGGKTSAGLKLSLDDTAIDMQEIRIRDADSQCRIGMKIEEDIFSITYAGKLKKETLDRVLLRNSFLQGWLEGDISVGFNQKNPRRSSAAGKLAWEKAGFAARDSMPIILTSAAMTVRDKVLIIESAGLSAGPDSAGVQGSIGFAEEGFALDLVVSAEIVDIDAITEQLAGDNASDGGGAEEFWETPLRGTVRFKARELKKSSFVCNPFEAVVSFDDRAVTVNTAGTQSCAVSLPATVLITPDFITLEVQPRAEKSSMQDLVRCLSGERDLITGVVDVAADMRAQAPPEALLASLEGNFSINASEGRIYRSGLIAKIVSFLSIRNLLSFSVRDMVKSGYPYQSWDIDGTIKGQTLEVSRAVLISDSFTLVCRGTVDLETDMLDIDALVTPFQIHNQVLSKVPLIGGWLSEPMLGVPLKISGKLGDVKISTRTTSAVTKGLVDITTGILRLPVRIISPVLPKKTPEE